MVFKADAKTGSALAGERHFQAGEWFWSEGKRDRPCIDWSLWGTLQRSWGGEGCLPENTALMAERQRGMMWLALNRVHRAWRSLFSWQRTLGRKWTWMLACRQMLATSQYTVWTCTGKTRMFLPTIRISYGCDDLVLIHDVAETGQDKSISGRKGWVWNGLLSLRKFNFWSEYKSILKKYFISFCI